MQQLEAKVLARALLSHLGGFPELSAFYKDVTNTLIDGQADKPI